MKIRKAALVLFLALVSSVSIYSCQKDSIDKRNTKEKESYITTSTSPISAEIGNNNGNASCDCPNQNKCEAKCVFVDCCVCWNASTHQGACACFLGFGSCKTEKNDEGGYIIDDPDVGHNTVARPPAIDEYIIFLEDNDITVTWEDEYAVIKSTYNVIDGETEYIHITSSDYKPLLLAYESFVSSLSSSDRTLIENYIAGL